MFYRKETCGNCAYWSGSKNSAMCYPCNHPKEKESREKGFRSWSRSEDDYCQGWKQINKGKE